MSCRMCSFEGLSAFAKELACCGAPAFATLAPVGLEGRSSACTVSAVQAQEKIAASSSWMLHEPPRYRNAWRDMVNLASATSHVHHIEIVRFETGKFAASMRRV